MAHLANLESKRRLTSSKLEQTILTNRTMNILLKKRLNLIEIDRKRALRAVGRMKKEVQADLRAMKDEKFNLMLKYQMNKTATTGPVSLDLPAPPQNNFASDIEGELFTTGLINAPGVNSRMKRLENRIRIRPDFDDFDDDDADTSSDEHVEENHDDFEHIIDRKQDKIRPHTAPNKISKTNESNKTSAYHAQNNVAKTKAVVMMTSGVVSLIDEDAELKQIAEVDETDNRTQDRTSTLPVPITGFGIHSQMRSRNGTPHSMPAENPRKGAIRSSGTKKFDRKKSVQFSRHRESIVVVKDVFGGEEPEEPDEPPLSNLIRGRGSHSRLSVVKSKIESNEKEFLLKLRIRNQKLENDDVAQRVWNFIGKRPISMFTPKKISPQKNEGDPDVLSEAEEERNMSKFKAAANKTSQDT